MRSKRYYWQGFVTGLIVASIFAFGYPYFRDMVQTISSPISESAITETPPTYTIDYQDFRFYVTGVQAGEASEGYIPWTVELSLENISAEPLRIDEVFTPVIIGTVGRESYTYYGKDLSFCCKSWYSYIPPGNRLNTNVIIPVAVTATVQNFALRIRYSDNNIGSIKLLHDNDYEEIPLVAEDNNIIPLSTEVNWIGGSRLSLDWVDIYKNEYVSLLLLGVFATNTSGQSVSPIVWDFSLFTNGSIFSCRHVSDSKWVIHPGETQKQIWKYLCYPDQISQVELHDIHILLLNGNLGSGPAKVDNWVLFHVPTVQEFEPESRLVEYQFDDPSLFHLWRDIDPEMAERIRKLLPP